MQPWPTPYAFLHQQGKKTMRVIVTKAKPVEGKADGAPTGEVIVDEDCPDRLMVATGDGGAVDGRGTGGGLERTAESFGFKICCGVE